MSIGENRVVVSDSSPKSLEKTPAPSSAASRGERLTAMAGVAVSVIYLLNLSAGFVELPDNLPIIGNLDEVFFSGLLFASLAKLGIRLPWTPRAPK